MTILRSLALCVVALAISTPFSRAVTYTTVDVPGASETLGVWDINNTGQMVGAYYDAAFQQHGFIDTNGTFTTLDFPGATATQLHGINDSGQVVGLYCASDGTCHGFYYDGTTFTTIEPKNVMESSLEKINNSGQMAGWAEDLASVDHAFTYDSSTSSFSSLRPPRGDDGVAHGINNLGFVVGRYSVGSTEPAFLYGGGRYRQIAYPAANTTEAQDINDSGAVVGFLTLDSQRGTQYHGFLYQTGQFVRFVFPGTSFTEALGINNAGMIVGLYGDSSNIGHGFLRTP